MKFEEKLNQLNDEELESVNGGLGIKVGFLKLDQKCETDEDAKSIYGMLNTVISNGAVDPTSFTDVLDAKTPGALMEALLATGYITSITESEATLLLNNIGALNLPSTL